MQNAISILHLTLFSDEQDAQSAGAAVAGDGASGGGFHNRLEDVQGLYCLADLGHGLVGDTGEGQESGMGVDILTALQALLDVGREGLGEVATVFLANGHLSVLDFDAGLQIQQVGAQCGCGGAAAAFDQIVQFFYQEACLHLFSVGVQRLDNSLHVGSRPSQTAGFQNHQALAGGEVLGIDAVDIVEFFRSQTGILVAGGEAGTQVDVDNGIVCLGMGTEHIFVFTDADGCCGTQVTTGGNMIEDFGGGDGDAVLELVIALDNSEGDQGDVMLPAG